MVSAGQGGGRRWAGAHLGRQRSHVLTSAPNLSFCLFGLLYFQLKEKNDSRGYFALCEDDDDGGMAPAQEEHEAGFKIDGEECLFLSKISIKHSTVFYSHEGRNHAAPWIWSANTVHNRKDCVSICSTDRREKFFGCGGEGIQSHMINTILGLKKDTIFAILFSVMRD